MSSYFIQSDSPDYNPAPQQSPALGDIETITKVAAATTFAKDRVSEFQQNLNEGNWSLRILSLLGALAMIMTSILGIGADFLDFHGVSAIFRIYSFILGVVMIVLEYEKQIVFLPSLEKTLYKNARFLKYVWGRGCLYFFAGTLQLSQDNFFNFIIGLFVCFVGITYIVVGRSAVRKIAEARRSVFSPQQIAQLFTSVDFDEQGTLTNEQFGHLTKKLGMDLTRREVELSFVQLDETQSGRLSYETVLKWWNNEATGEQDNFNSQLFL